MKQRVSAVVAFTMAMGWGAAGCTSDKAEARALVTAVDAYTAASNDNRPTEADRVSAITCTARDVCDAREACVRMAWPTAEAMRLTAEVDLRLGDAAPRDPAVTRDLASKLARASDLLEKGHAAASECLTKIASLRVKYQL